MTDISNKILLASVLGLLVALLVPHSHVENYMEMASRLLNLAPSSPSNYDPSSYEPIRLHVHMNGEYGRCHKSPYVLSTPLPISSRNYSFDSHLTDSLLSFPEIDSGCGPVVGEGTFKDFCDMGPEKTVILEDHDSLVPVPSTRTLPCSYYTREGRRITSLSNLIEFASLSSAPLDVYAVAAGRLFQFAPGEVGETFDLSHLPHPQGKKMYLETMSVSPKVFEIKNFFVEEEADDLIERAIGSSSKTHGLKRSTTGVDSEQGEISVHS